MAQEIQDFFMEEAEEIFDNLHSILLKNEEAGDISKDEIDSLFRDVHTLKGGAGSVELMMFSRYTHNLENFMDMVRNGKIDLDKEVVSFLIDGVDEMQELLQAEYDEELEEDELQEKMNALISKIEDIKNKNSQNSSENDSNNENDEMFELFDNLNILLQAVKDGESNFEDALNDIFRHIHTLKGSSIFLDLKMFPTYLHEVETLLDQIRNGVTNNSTELNDFLIEVSSTAQEIIEDELSGTLDSKDFSIKLSDLKTKISNILPKSEDEAVEFELFDENIPEDEVVEFELFDENIPEDEVVEFELFDTVDIPDEKIEDKKEQKKEEISKNEDIKKEKKPESKKKDQSSKKDTNTSIRVNLDKIELLMNRVGDLVITKSMLFQFADLIPDEKIRKDMYEKLSDLDRDVRELQESVMSVRMVPMKSVYSRIPKMVRDIAKKLDKKVEFVHKGDDVEIDKLMVEGLVDPLTHMIRNSLDHGIEEPEVRIAKGKPKTGVLTISATQESENIVISIIDDGAGINVDRVTQKAIDNALFTQDEIDRMSEQDKLMLIFNAGLSTAESITDVSGRGVGMDVVMNNISSLGGYIKVFSTKDKGSEFQIILPLTLAILDGLNIVVGDKKFVLPLANIVESLQPKEKMIQKIGSDEKEMLMLRDEFIPVIRLYEHFKIKPKHTKIEEGMLIVVKSANSKFAFFVDDFLNQEQIVVKSLEKNYKNIHGIGAATIRGDGSVGLILDVTSITNQQVEVS